VWVHHPASSGPAGYAGIVSEWLVILVIILLLLYLLGCYVCQYLLRAIENIDNLRFAAVENGGMLVKRIERVIFLAGEALRFF
jgi:hypothetical protein